MVKGSSAAREAAAKAVEDGAGQGSVLTAAGKEWAAKAGGTSGVLWGAMLSALGARLGDTGRPDSATVAAGMRDGYDALIQLGGAAPGDKTMLDALLPFVEELERRVADGEPWQQAWRAAAESPPTPRERPRICGRRSAGPGRWPNAASARPTLVRRRWRCARARSRTASRSPRKETTDMTSRLRIVVGSDDAGYEYKEALKGDLAADSRSPRSPMSASGPTRTPPTRMWRWRRRAWSPRAKPIGRCWSAAPAWAWRSAPTRCPASAPSPHTTASRSSARCCRTTRRSLLRAARDRTGTGASSGPRMAGL